MIVIKDCSVVKQLTVFNYGVTVFKKKLVISHNCLANFVLTPPNSGVSVSGTTLLKLSSDSNTASCAGTLRGSTAWVASLACICGFLGPLELIVSSHFW